MQTHTVTTSSSSHAEVHALDELRQVLAPDLTSCRWERSLEPWLRAPLEALARARSGMERTCVVTRRDPRGLDKLLHGMRVSPVRTWLAQDIEQLARAYLDVSGEARCRVKLEVVERSACRRLHYDFVRLRMLCTYAGLGTLWVGREHVDVAALEHTTGNFDAENRKIVRDPRHLRTAGPGDVLLLKGASFPGHTGAGAVHRSPFADREHPRLVLTIDGMLESPLD